MSELNVIGLVNEAADGEATVVCAAGNMPGELLRLWRPEDPKAYHLEYGFSCMGYEIPGGIGVKLAEPERDVVVMIGDRNLSDDELRDCDCRGRGIETHDRGGR